MPTLTPKRKKNAAIIFVFLFGAKITCQCGLQFGLCMLAFRRSSVLIAIKNWLSVFVLGQRVNHRPSSQLANRFVFGCFVARFSSAQLNFKREKKQQKMIYDRASVCVVDWWCPVSVYSSIWHILLLNRRRWFHAKFSMQLKVENKINKKRRKKEIMLGSRRNCLFGNERKTQPHWRWCCCCFHVVIKCVAKYSFNHFVVIFTSTDVPLTKQKQNKKHSTKWNCIKMGGI